MIERFEFLGLRVGSFEFFPIDTVLIIVCAACALVSIVELVRLSRRERFQQRLAGLGHAVATHNLGMRQAGAHWYGRLGVLIGQSPLVGIAEQERLIFKLASAGIGGPGRLATFIAGRFLSAFLFGLVTWGAIIYPQLLAEYPFMRVFPVAFGAIVGWRLPDMVVSWLARRRSLRLEVGFPDALDMLVICAEAGLGLEQAMGYVANDMRFAMPEVAEEFNITQAEMRVMANRLTALENLAKRTGLETLQALVAILNQSVRFGTPLSDALKQLTADARMVRMSRLEERAGRLSVMLLMPVMGFVLPSLILVIGGPIALRAIDLFSEFMAH